MERRPITPGEVPISESDLQPLVDARRRFLAFIESRVGDSADAEDILQTAYAKVAEKRETLDDRASIVPWFYQILRNAITDHYRHAAARSRALQRPEAASDLTTEPDAEVERSVCECFRALLPNLTEDQRDILERVDLAEATPTDVAGELGITPNAARVRLHRARHALREELERTCRTCAEHGCLDCSCGS